MSRLFPAFKPHEIGALPKHYHDVLKNYYYLLHPPREDSGLDESGLGDGPKVVDFDKLSGYRKSLMRNDWDQSVKKGEPV